MHFSSLFSALRAIHSRHGGLEIWLNMAGLNCNVTELLVVG